MNQRWQPLAACAALVPWAGGGLSLIMLLECWWWYLACNINGRIEGRQGCKGQRYYRHPMPLPLVSLSGGTPGVERLILACCNRHKLFALACLMHSDSQSRTCICETAAEIQRAQRLQAITGPPGWIMTRHLHAACRIGIVRH